MSSSNQSREAPVYGFDWDRGITNLSAATGLSRTETIEVLAFLRTYLHNVLVDEYHKKNPIPDYDSMTVFEAAQRALRPPEEIFSIEQSSLWPLAEMLDECNEVFTLLDPMVWAGQMVQVKIAEDQMRRLSEIFDLRQQELIHSVAQEADTSPFQFRIDRH